MTWERWGIATTDTADFFKSGATLDVEKNKDFAGVDFKISGRSGSLGGTPEEVYSSTYDYSNIVKPDKYFTVKRDDEKKKLIFTESTKDAYDKYVEKKKKEHCESRPDHEWNGTECVKKKTQTTSDSGGRRRRRRKSRRKSRKSRRKSRKTKRKRRKSRKTKKRRRRRR